MSEPRSYVVGLPVIISVWDDGGVSYEIDTSEASREVSRTWDEGTINPPPEAVVMADVDRIDAAQRGG